MATPDGIRNLIWSNPLLNSYSKTMRAFERVDKFEIILTCPSTGDEVLYYFDMHSLGLFARLADGRVMSICPRKGCRLASGGGDCCGCLMQEIKQYEASMDLVVERGPIFTSPRVDSKMMKRALDAIAYSRGVYDRHTEEGHDRLIESIGAFYFYDKDLGILAFRCRYGSSSLKIFALNLIGSVNSCGVPGCNQPGSLTNSLTYFCIDHLTYCQNPVGLAGMVRVAYAKLFALITGAPEADYVSEQGINFQIARWLFEAGATGYVHRGFQMHITRGYVLRALSHTKVYPQRMHTAFYCISCHGLLRGAHVWWEYYSDNSPLCKGCQAVIGEDVLKSNFQGLVYGIYESPAVLSTYVYRASTRDPRSRQVVHPPQYDFRPNQGRGGRGLPRQRRRNTN